MRDKRMILIKYIYFVPLLFILSCGISDVAVVFQINQKLEKSRENREKKIQGIAKTVESKKDEAVDDLTIAQQDRYEYSSIGKKDPFGKKDIEMKIKQEEKQKEREINPLQLYEISQFKLVGTVSSTTNPMALLQAPDSKSYLVKVGNIVGKNRGYVTTITKYNVVIVQEYRDASGKTLKKSSLLKIETDEDKDGTSAVSGGEE